MEVALPQRAHHFGDVYISGQARVQLGDAYTANRDLFEGGTEDECLEALRTALAFDGMLTREQQISLSDISSTSFQWVRGSSIIDWLMSPEPFFWIAGKPGSGKSTLMKHLIQSKWTLDTLNQGSRKPWKIVYFYFDYRAGNAVANHPLGMVRRFVRQLCKELKLDGKTELKKLLRKETNVDDYIAFLAEAVRNMSIHLCAFVDGLDEYEGDLWELCETLDRLQIQAGIKMCLASRPEDAFRNFLSIYPSISMQEHNGPSIAIYVERKIHRKAAIVLSIHDLFPATLQKAIRDRAEGVILWAKLVVDEMVDGCSETTTTESLLTFLESLPRELESLYDRILGKLNKRFKGEAALLVHMLTEAGGSKEKNLLYAAWSFVQVNILRFPAPQWPLNSHAFDTRLSVLLGNMVDVTTRTKSRGDEHQIFVRLMHKSISSYLSKTDWVVRNLPPLVLTHYSTDFFWQRLHTDVLSKASEQDAVPPDVLGNLAVKVLSPEQILKFTHVYSPKKLPFQAHDLSSELEAIISPHWKIWRDLLTTSLRSYPDFTKISSLRIDSSKLDTVDLCPELPLASGASRVLLLHCAFCDSCAEFVYTPWHISRAKRLYENDVLHVLIDISHRQYTWLTNPLADKVNNLTPQVSEDVFDIVLLSPKLLTLRDKHMLERLSKRGTVFEGRHLCTVGLSKHIPEVYAAYDNALKCRSHVPWTLSHDPDCRYVGTDDTLAKHWNDVSQSYAWREIFERCDIRFDASLPSARSQSVDDGVNIVVQPAQALASGIQTTVTKPKMSKRSNHKDLEAPVLTVKPLKASIPKKLASRLRSLMSND